jgi:hypothetical protein
MSGTTSLNISKKYNTWVQTVLADKEVVLCADKEVVASNNLEPTSTR